MNNIENSGPEKNTSSMRRLLADGTNKRPNRYGGPSRSWGQFVIPGILVLTLLIGVAILAYSFGVSRGKGNSNLERDKFLEVRAASWNATATAQAAVPPAGASSPAIVPQNSFNINSSVYARVDKIEGAKVTVLLLTSDGQPSGSSTVLTLVPNKTQVWRNTPTQLVELRVGDTVLFAGQPNGADGYDAQSIVVLAEST
jgi:hypothetical protein